MIYGCKDFVKDEETVCFMIFILLTETADDMLVIQQEQENRDMLERFRSAHMDAEERDLKLQQAEGLNNSFKLELLSSDTERRHLREKVSLQDREIQEVE